jgi:hypothetical protein
MLYSLLIGAFLLKLDQEFGIAWRVYALGEFIDGGFQFDHW